MGKRAASCPAGMGPLGPVRLAGLVGIVGMRPVGLAQPAGPVGMGLAVMRPVRLGEKGTEEGGELGEFQQEAVMAKGGGDFVILRTGNGGSHGLHVRRREEAV